jgi:hypothetical protein
MRFRPHSEADIAAEERQRLDACWTAVAGLSCVDTIRAAYFQSEQMLRALRAGVPERILRVLCLEIAHTGAEGEAARRRIDNLLALGDDLAQRCDDPYSKAMLLLARATSSGLCGRFPECQEFGDRSEAEFRAQCTGVNWELDTLHRFVTWCLAYRGEIAELNRRLPALIQEARDTGNLYAETNLTTFVIPLLHLAADDPQRARDELRDSMSHWTQQGFHVQHLTRVYDEANIDLYLGDGRRALENLDRCWPEIQESQLLRVCQLRIFLTDAHARAALSASTRGENREALLRRALTDAKRLAGEKDGYARALAVTVRAGAAAIRGERIEAVKLFQTALADCERLTLPIQASACRMRLSELLPGDEARVHREAALAWMSGQGICNPSAMAAMYSPPP